MDIETIKVLARIANKRGNKEALALCLEALEDLIPFGGEHDEFRAFCTQLERESIKDFGSKQEKIENAEVPRSKVT